MSPLLEAPACQARRTSAASSAPQTTCRCPRHACPPRLLPCLLWLKQAATNTHALACRSSSGSRRLPTPLLLRAQFCISQECCRLCIISAQVVEDKEDPLVSSLQALFDVIAQEAKKGPLIVFIQVCAWDREAAGKGTARPAWPAALLAADSCPRRALAGTRA